VYAALWRALPGPVWLRILILAALAAIVLFVLVTWVFPWIDSYLALTEDTVGP